MCINVAVLMKNSSEGCKTIYNLLDWIVLAFIDLNETSKG
jgi:hypothetical protein